jgi:hypothetical protein
MLCLDNLPIVSATSIASFACILINRTHDCRAYLSDTRLQIRAYPQQNLCVSTSCECTVVCDALGFVDQHCIYSKTASIQRLGRAGIPEICKRGAIPLHFTCALCSLLSIRGIDLHWCLQHTYTFSSYMSALKLHSTISANFFAPIMVGYFFLIWIEDISAWLARPFSTKEEACNEIDWLLFNSWAPVSL